MSNWSRVCKQMVKMFGPQFTEKFGSKNDAWEEALKPLSYSQVSAGLSKVMNGALKFYEVDLPRFLDLCRPPPAPPKPFEIEMSPEMAALCVAERSMRYQANGKLTVWSLRHPVYGLDGPKSFTKAQQKALLAATAKITHDFFEMREELGAKNVPDEEFFHALTRSWERAVAEE